MDFVLGIVVGLLYVFHGHFSLLYHFCLLYILFFLSFLPARLVISIGRHSGTCMSVASCWDNKLIPKNK